jgi:hypothetical protein
MTQKQVEASLAQLGNTPGEVASGLQARRVQGVRGAVRFLNPVIRYLQDVLRLDTAALDVMHRDRVRIRFGDGRRAEVPLPGPVRLFLDGFNRGDYPEIELPPERA